MTNDKKYDLEDRTGKFGEDIIEFAKAEITARRIAPKPKKILSTNLVSAKKNQGKLSIG